MSTSTITIRPGQLARVSPDLNITRGLAETHTLTLLDANGSALAVTGITGWVMQVTQDFLTKTPPLAVSQSAIAASNVLSVTLNANTVELRDFMEGKALSLVFATLVGLDSSGNPVRLITFRIVALNSNYDPEAEPTPVQAGQFYNAAQIDVKFAEIGNTLGIPTDLSDLTDEDGLLSGKIEAVTALPAPVVGILNRAYFLTAADGEKAKGTTWKCVADGESYVFQQIQTDLSSLTDATGILAGKENVANKATDFSTVDNTKFPTTQAVTTYVSGVVGDIEAVLDELIGGAE